MITKTPPYLATTEKHRIEDLGKTLLLVNCETTVVIDEVTASREGALELVGKILELETEHPAADGHALTFSCAALDQELRRREERDDILQSLCAQIEIYEGRTPLPERRA